MSKMRKAQEVIAIFNNLEIALSLEDTKFKFKKFCIRFKASIKSSIDEIKTLMDKNTEKLKKLQAEYAEKDKDGKAIIHVVKIGEKDGEDIVDRRYAGLLRGENSEYDSKVDELKEELEEILNDEHEISFEEKIEEKNLPLKNKGFTGHVMESMIDNIEE